MRWWRRHSGEWRLPEKSNDPEQPKLGQRGDPVIETDLRDYLAVLEFEDGDAGEVHLPARVGGQAASEEVLKGRTGVGAAALLASTFVVEFFGAIRSVGLRCS
jgi:hypothetical protein